MKTRLQKILAEAGIASRRKAEEIIAAGRVTVNGAVVTELGAKAEPSDAIAVDGVPISIQPKKVYIMLNKPKGVVTTASDQFGRPTVLDLIDAGNSIVNGGNNDSCTLPENIRLFPVGRLDYDSDGLIFLTNDGEWANKLTHPKYGVRKTYIATVKGVPTEESLRDFQNGLIIDGRRTAPCKASVIKKGDASAGASSSNNTKLRIIIREGRNRQIRKMCESIGHPVISLTRVAIGKVELSRLPHGKWQHLTQREIRLALERGI